MMSEDYKPSTFRIHYDMSTDMETVAKIEGVSMSEFVRQAIAEAIAKRRQDSDFQRRLRESVDRNQEILDRLAEVENEDSE